MTLIQGLKIFVWARARMYIVQLYMPHGQKLDMMTMVRREKYWRMPSSLWRVPSSANMSASIFHSSMSTLTSLLTCHINFLCQPLHYKLLFCCSRLVPLGPSCPIGVLYTGPSVPDYAKWRLQTIVPLCHIDMPDCLLTIFFLFL